MLSLPLSFCVLIHVTSTVTDVCVIVAQCSCRAANGLEDQVRAGSSPGIKTQCERLVSHCCTSFLKNY